MNINLGLLYQDSYLSNEVHYNETTSRAFNKKGNSPLGLGSNNLSFQPNTPANDPNQKVLFTQT